MSNERIFRNVSEGQGAPEVRVNAKTPKGMRERKQFNEEWLLRFEGLAEKRSTIEVDFERFKEIAKGRGKELQIEDIDTPYECSLFYTNVSSINTITLGRTLEDPRTSVKTRIEMFKLQDLLQGGAVIIFDQADFDAFLNMFECVPALSDLIATELEKDQIVVVVGGFRRQK